jgi:thymidine kinase
MIHSYHKRDSGSIEVITGPMFSGKTTELLRRMRLSQLAKMNTILFKPQADIRCSADETVTHDKEKGNCITIASADEIPAKIKEYEEKIQKLFQARTKIRELFKAGEFNGLINNEIEFSERFFGPFAITGAYVNDPFLESQPYLDEHPDLVQGRIRVVGIEEGQFFKKLVDTCMQLRDQGLRTIVAGLDQDFRRQPFGEMGPLIAVSDEVSKLKAVCLDCGDAALFSKRLIASQKQIEIGGEGEYAAVCEKCYQKP